MLLKKIGNNMNEIILNNGDQVLISYETKYKKIKIQVWTIKISY